MREEFEKEMDRWIEEDIIVPWNDKVEGVIPLMAVEQPKKKVRPVLDFREFNKFVECHTGDDFIDNCDKTLRKWRQMYQLLTLNLLIYNLKLKEVC